MEISQPLQLLPLLQPWRSLSHCRPLPLLQPWRSLRYCRPLPLLRPWRSLSHYSHYRYCSHGDLSATAAMEPLLHSAIMEISQPLPPIATTAAMEISQPLQPITTTAAMEISPLLQPWSHYYTLQPWRFLSHCSHEATTTYLTHCSYKATTTHCSHGDLSATTAIKPLLHTAAIEISPHNKNRKVV